MTTSKDLMLAILAMDSYNRGYGSGLGNSSDGLGGAGSQIGDATLNSLPDGTDLATWKTDGFYAAAYTIGEGVDGIASGSTVISYRGTDNFNLLSTSSDIWNGWVGSVGYPASQYSLAIDF